MKKIIFFLALSTTILFTSCKGDPGPRGQDGQDFLAQVYEVTVNNYQYDSANNQLYSNIWEYPFTVYESDAILVYRLSGQDPDVNPPADVWSLLPQNIFYNDGTGDFFQYNFNHSFLSVQFTIEGNFPLTNIDSRDVTNQVFRIAVVPSEYAKTNPSMKELVQVMEKNDTPLKKLEQLDL